MYRRIRKTKHKNRQAFTLVELIVVLVILAVIAAVTVPALIGYIDKTNKEKCIPSADTARVAAQAVMTELYGLGGDYKPSDSVDGNNFVWTSKSGTATDKAWGDKVLALMDRGRGTAGNEPYIFIFGVGHSSKDCGLTLNQQYTVYYIAYVETPDSPAVFYVDGEWMFKYPRKNGGSIIRSEKYNGKEYRNTIVRDGKPYTPLQFFIVSNNTGMADDKIWTNSDKRSLLSHSDGYA